jgi:DNA-binding HxlR family transcriptional regulator
VKSYNQSCPVATALDVVGDRWSLLILREVLVQGPCRYTDLAHGLPGIATNMLTDRLKNLEEGGLIWREYAPPPVATTLFHLSEKGAAIEPVLVALGRWGVENLDRPGPDVERRDHWMPFAVSLYLRNHAPEGLPLVIQLNTPFGTGVVDVDQDGVRTRVGTASSPDLTIGGSPQVIIGLLSGSTTRAEARKLGVTVEGDSKILADFQPALAL